ncbi:MAG: hypothetical protein ACI3ZT_00810 [Candidatus Cryptobacteroides sp.]
MARINREIKHIGGFLIGDSDEHGKDQIISKDIYFPHPEHNVANQQIIDEAMAFAREHHYTNIRCELIKSWAITIPQGIIGWKQYSHKVVKFTDKIKDIFVCAN